MKQQIRIKQGDKIISGETKIIDTDHLKACIKYPSLIYKPKKGKGSYTRKSK